jgi:2-methylisocitrate lyase-like PEP mutase family enzyme
MLPDAPRRLRELLAAPGLVWGPGVYDGISARVADAVGFPMLYMTGAGTAASRTGQADLGLTTQTEMAETARTIASVSRAPVVADADTGYGGPLNVARTVHFYESAGIAALHIEDQVFPKRCGHLAGKAVVPVAEYLQRIRAAVNERHNPDFVVIARTDARQPNGLDDAIDRINRAFDAGADLGFLEGPHSIAEMEQTIAKAQGPMLLNLAAHGDTPNLTAPQVEALGFKMAIFPTASMLPAALAMRAALETLKSEGTDAGPTAGYSPRDFFALMGLADSLAVDARAGSASLAEV